MTKETDENTTTDPEKIVTAISRLVKEIPIYEDAVQPFAKEVGKSLKTTG